MGLYVEMNFQSKCSSGIYFENLHSTFQCCYTVVGVSKIKIL